MEAFKAKLLAERELAKQKCMEQVQIQNRLKTGKFIRQLDALPPSTLTKVATGGQWKREQQWTAEQHAALLEMDFT